MVVFEPINQIGRARNKGAEAASGDWLIFIDADSQASKGLFVEVIETIRKGNVLYGGCTIKLEGFHLVANAVTLLWNVISRVGKYVAGSFIFCEAAAFRKLGGFDNRLFAGEEIDLSQRLWQLARQTGKKAVILHRNKLLTSARKLHLYSGREHLRFLRKTLFGWRRAVTSRDACHTWYDGRR
jgi:glycosyltransferase involved in cell wall biosynthesis